MSYSKEQFIEDFKNAYNQSQQLHFIYRYVEDGGKNIKSINFITDKVGVDTDIAVTITLSDGEILKTDTIRVANDTLSTMVQMLDDDVQDLKKYKGYDVTTYNKNNCVRIDEPEISLEENTLVGTFGTTKTVNDDELLIIDTLIKKAIKYGFVIWKTNDGSYDILPLVCARLHTDEIICVFGGSSVQGNEGHGFIVKLNYNTKQYNCDEEEI